MSAKANPKVKDFKKLNKVVLAEGATNAMVSGIEPKGSLWDLLK